MQRILLSSLFFLITLTITAQQEQTLFNSGRGISLTGFWAGGNSSLYDFQDNKTLSNGGYATFEFNNNFLIGWSGYKSDITNQGQEIDIDGIKSTFPNLIDLYSGDLLERESTDSINEAICHQVQKLP
ncbi:MAG: hypothetical protein AAFR14_09180, partial [Bacteroidota bacterium]